MIMQQYLFLFSSSLSQEVLASFSARLLLQYFRWCLYSHHHLFLLLQAHAISIDQMDQLDLVQNIHAMVEKHRWNSRHYFWLLRWDRIEIGTVVFPYEQLRECWRSPGSFNLLELMLKTKNIDLNALIFALLVLKIALLLFYDSNCILRYCINLGFIET